VRPSASARRSVPNVTRWLEHPSRVDRWHLHFTPTSASWLNLVERWFRELTDKRLRRDSFTSVAELVDAIELWVEHWNDDPKPSYGIAPHRTRHHRQGPTRTSRPQPGH
jgi:hypothetical protein